MIEWFLLDSEADFFCLHPISHKIKGKLGIMPLYRINGKSWIYWRKPHEKQAWVPRLCRRLTKHAKYDNNVLWSSISCLFTSRLISRYRLWFLISWAIRLTISWKCSSEDKSFASSSLAKSSLTLTFLSAKDFLWNRKCLQDLRDRDQGW